jgi:transposase
MQGHKQFTDRVVLRFRLSERVPQQNLYRRLSEVLDWEFLYQQTQALSSHTGQLYPAAVFEQLFNHVFAQCVAAGLVMGHTQAVDSAFVKANASLERLCEKQPADVPTPVL